MNFFMKRSACEYLSRATKASIFGSSFLAASGCSLGYQRLCPGKLRWLAVDVKSKMSSVGSSVVVLIGSATAELSAADVDAFIDLAYPAAALTALPTTEALI